MPDFVDPIANALIRHLSAGDSEAYLVGGYVRDLLSERASYDLDVAIKGDAVRAGRRAADALVGAFYVLDAARGAARVLVSDNDRTRDIDFAPLKDGDIESDLRARDFTVNAMALSVAHPSLDALIDPLGGRDDLAHKRLRAVSDSAIRDDPIRALRAVRLSHQLGLSVERTTWELIGDAVSLLAGASHERIRDELFRVLALPRARNPLVDLHESGALWTILETLGAPPDPADRRTERVARAAGTVTSLEALLTLDHDAIPDDTLGQTYAQVLIPFASRLEDELSRRTSGSRTRVQLLKWMALLLHLVDAPSVALVASGLRLSGAELQAVRTMATLIQRPDEWAAVGRTSNVQLYRFFREAGSFGVEVLVLYLAECLAAARRGETLSLIQAQTAVVESALRAYFDRYRSVVAPPAMITGDMLIERYGLTPGPSIGRLLERLREAQAAGTVHNPEEAAALVERWLDERASSEDSRGW